jgi:hypothetical protein
MVSGDGPARSQARRLRNVKIIEEGPLHKPETLEKD